MSFPEAHSIFIWVSNIGTIFGSSKFSTLLILVIKNDHSILFKIWKYALPLQQKDSFPIYRDKTYAYNDLVDEMINYTPDSKLLVWFDYRLALKSLNKEALLRIAENTFKINEFSPEELRGIMSEIRTEKRGMEERVKLYNFLGVTSNATVHFSIALTDSKKRNAPHRCVSSLSDLECPDRLFFSVEIIADLV